MAEKLSGEGRKYRTLLDGRVLYRSYYLRQTVILQADEFARLDERRGIGLLVGVVLGFPGAIFVNLLLQGAFRVPTAVITGLGMAVMICLAHVILRKRHLKIVSRAPVSPEQIPAPDFREIAGFVLKTIPDDVFNHSIKLFGFAFVTGVVFLIGKLLGAGFANTPKTPPMIAMLPMVLVSGPALYWLWKERKRRRRDKSR